VTFQSSIAVFAVCPYCRSMVVRHDVNVEAIGQMAQLPPDLSPLQIGAHGEMDGQGFTLIRWTIRISVTRTGRSMSFP